MPIYEVYCADHDLQEGLFPMSESDSPTLPCPICGAPCPRQASRVTMFPDDAWMGVASKVGYVTSRSEYKRIMKERGWVEIGDRSDQEAMKKMAEEGVKNRKEREARERRKFLEESFSNAGVIDSFGNVRPEATVKLSDERLLE